ncbi:MAG TPA: hydroxymethylbilane synthase, partial [Oligoflexia bacterium]|nr:hydroxymethylbilane synthase [Oligoflexia bacterium]
MPHNIYRIGTRGSELALKQAALVSRALGADDASLSTEIAVIMTSGDRLSGDQTGVRDKKEWIAEIEESLLQGEIELAVHSAKDVPLDIAPGTVLVPVLKRECPFDVYLTKMPDRSENVPALPYFPRGSCVATASSRRRAQLLHLRRDLSVVPLRGNVPTRLAKFRASNEISGLVLAGAGLVRLGLSDEIHGYFSAAEILPAVNQGILLVQMRRDDEKLYEHVLRLVDRATFFCWSAERSFIRVLGADCNSAVGVLAEIEGGLMRITARVLSSDGRICLERDL